MQLTKLAALYRGEQLSPHENYAARVVSAGCLQSAQVGAAWEPPGVLASCDMFDSDLSFVGDFGALMQDESMLEGSWVLRKSCGEDDCESYTLDDSAVYLHITSDREIRRIEECDIVVRSHSYQIVENAFPDNDHGLTAGLKIYEWAPHQFGVSDRALYLSIGPENHVTEWFERRREPKCNW